jgi:Right handed beta helix region
MSRTAVVLAAACAIAAMVAVPVTPAPAATPNVLRVGSYHGVHGTLRTIQAAVDAARPGDWILIGPGDYHERSYGGEAGVYITTPGIHLRGMDRNRVVVDGTKRGTSPCDPAASAQDFGPIDEGTGQPAGRSGVWVSEVDGVSLENLTACNFLSSADGENGNQIWFNGGDGSGGTHLGSFRGAYLSATSTYGALSGGMAQYGIFVSNTFGPGTITDTYSSNMADSAYYVGACPDCRTVLTRSHAENSALGYSGTNSGGRLLIENSEWDGNRTGIVPNSLNNDDAPPPQDGTCPAGVTGFHGTDSCTVITGNDIHDNNNPNAPAFGIAGEGAIGAGIEIAGGKNDTITGNTITHQGGWGIVTHDYPDTETPPPVSHCQGGHQVGPVCLFLAVSSQVLDNTLSDNGFFGNVGNVDLANQDTSTNGNCFQGNADTAGRLTSDPPLIETVDGLCNGPDPGDDLLGAQLLCASGLFGQCPVGAHYPQRTGVDLIPLPAQTTMPDPCGGVPSNPWCPAPALRLASARGPASTSSSSTAAPWERDRRRTGAPGASRTWRT